MTRQFHETRLLLYPYQKALRLRLIYNSGNVEAKPLKLVQSTCRILTPQKPITPLHSTSHVSFGTYSLTTTFLLPSDRDEKLKVLYDQTLEVGVLVGGVVEPASGTKDALFSPFYLYTSQPSPNTQGRASCLDL